MRQLSRRELLQFLHYTTNIPNLVLNGIIGYVARAGGSEQNIEPIESDKPQEPQKPLRKRASRRCVATARKKNAMRKKRQAMANSISI